MIAHLKTKPKKIARKCIVSALKSLFLAASTTALSANALAMEPFEDLQWALQNTGAPQDIELDHVSVQKIPGKSGEDINMSVMKKAEEKVIVAVLDTGLDKSHPEFRNKLKTNPRECEAFKKFIQCQENESREKCEEKWMTVENPEVDLDGNGYAMDCQGWSLIGGLNPDGVVGKPDFGDDNGHGTHVSGIIAASRSNGEGIKGCGENVEILPVQVLGANPSEPLKPLSLESKSKNPTMVNSDGVEIDLGPAETPERKKYKKTLGDIVARGVLYAIHSGAKVINFSMGWAPAKDSELAQMAIKLAQERGILIVAAAGNDSTQALLRPCSYPGVICVASHGPDGAISHFSNFGSGVDIAAPGLNILSTWPMEQRPARFRSDHGYEFLHGTSQATPYVSCAAAELMAQGFSPQETRARLLLGARPHQPPQDMITKFPHLTESVSNEFQKILDKKKTLTGNLDINQSMSVPPQPLLTLISRDSIEIEWDRNALDLEVPIVIKNTWKAGDVGSFNISMAEFSEGAIRPQLTRVEGNFESLWAEGEERTFTAFLKITDSEQAETSRIPSEFNLSLKVSQNGLAKNIDVPVLISVPVSREFNPPGTFHLAINNPPKGRVSFTPIDENLDSEAEYQDYLAKSEKGNTWTYYLIQQNRSENPETGSYDNKGSFEIEVEDKGKGIREQITARLDWDLDGVSEYVIGHMLPGIEDEKGEAGPAGIALYILDQKFNLLKKIEKRNEKALFPHFVSWLTVNGKKVPAWVGTGFDPYKKKSLRDLWENPDQTEVPEIRMYYVDIESKIQAIKVENGYTIVDILNPSDEQVIQGTLPILLAKNSGKKNSPSAVNNFATALVENDQVTNFKNLEFSGQGVPYRNLLSTKVDKIYNLNHGETRHNGTFWFGGGKTKQQRLSGLIQTEPTLKNSPLEFVDYDLPAMRGAVDATLWVRSVYSSSKGNYAFSITNSEIQFHALDRDQIKMISLNRYTFFDDGFTTNIQFPLVIEDQIHRDMKLPALFTTEGSKQSSGIRVTVPTFDQNGDLVELNVPAKLRLKAGRGCRPVDHPIWSKNRGVYIDYYCKTKLIRIPLEY